MKLYAAATSTFPVTPEIAVRGGFRHVLVSYAEGEKFVTSTIFECRKSNVGMFLDSGAFAAYTRGLKIPIEKYTAFCTRIGPLVDAVACLDVIGDEAATRRNEDYMHRAGLSPVITCHFGMSGAEVVARFRGAEYGALGGMALRSRSGHEMRRKWLDEVFGALMKSDVWPIKIHGYGMTDSALIERYPWYSVDSTTWAMASVYGNEMVRKGRLLVQRDSALYPQFGTSARIARTVRSAPRVAEFGEYCTRLWEKRGITWNP